MQVVLSTPSFGITGKGKPLREARGLRDFQLPLSGSPKADFDRRAQAVQKTFNSLFRDHFLQSLLSLTLMKVTFNSLFRDHRALFRDFSALRGVLPRRPFAQMIPKATI